MTPVMREVVVRIVATVPLAGAAVRAVLPRVGAAVTATASSPRAALTGTPSAQTGQRLRDGFGGIVRFGGHEVILHAT
ncbi:hypothetical protein MOX01_05820 [Microbacterium oxydans]|nr:hypothetical protein MOX01_05820 [Microbacterium oxydans]